MRKKTTGKIGVAGLKLDMAKAYDRVEWPFLERVLKSMGFPTNWVSLIMNCVSSVSFAVLLNGSPCDTFTPDPLSPYLFILCAEVLSGLIRKGTGKSSYPWR